MYEITNRMKGPISLMVRSTRKSNSFTTLTIPGKGKGKNVVILEDELMTEYVTQAEDHKLILVKKIGRN